MSQPTVACEVVAEPMPGPERRLSVRCLSGPETVCTLIDIPEAELWPAWVRDLSATGIGLLSARAFAPGTLVGIELDNQTHGLLRRIPARVIHAIEWPTDYWLHGCAFLNPLTPEEMRALTR